MGKAHVREKSPNRISIPILDKFGCQAGDDSVRLSCPVQSVTSLGLWEG